MGWLHQRYMLPLPAHRQQIQRPFNCAKRQAPELQSGLAKQPPEAHGSL